MPSHPSVRLLVGTEELLLRRAAEAMLEELRAEAGELIVTDIHAGDLKKPKDAQKQPELPEMRTGSLFGEPRVVMLRDVQDLPAEVTDRLLSDLNGPPLDVTLILLASGTGKILKLAKRVKEVGERIDIAPPKEWDPKGWTRLVVDEFKRHGRTADQRAVDALLGHAGFDVSLIAGKVAQVASTAPAGTISAAHVEAVVVGVGSRGAFAVADAMVARNPAAALNLLSGVLDAGDDPLKVMGALTYKLRSLVAVAGGLDPKSVGLNIPPSQAQRLRAARQNFGPGEMTGAFAELSRADLAIKSGEVPPRLAVERAVVAIATRSS